METLETYVMQYPDGKFVDLDPQSGGYPYPVNHWSRAHQWNTLGEVDRYRGRGSDFVRFSIVKLTTTVEIEIIAEAGEIIPD